MKEAGVVAPTSGPTIAAPQGLARDRTTGRFAPTEGRGRSGAECGVIAARWARVAALYPHKTAREIADEIDEGRWSPATIAKDVVALAALGLIEEIRQPGARRKHPDAEPRVCANPDCPRGGEPFPRESWETDRRYCSISCARANPSERVREAARKVMTESHRRAEAAIARLNAAGYLTSRQLAAERKVTESVVSSWIARGMLKAGDRRIIEGEPHRVIARREFDRFNAEEWPRILERMGPNFPSNWRGPRRRLWSRRLRAPIVGKLGGVKARYDPDQERRVREAKAAFPTWGPVTISRVVSRATGKPLTPYQVRGILEKKPA